MDNALALMVKAPDFAGAMNEGREAEQRNQLNALAMKSTQQNMQVNHLNMQAKQQDMERADMDHLFKMIGSASMHALGGRIDGEPDPARWGEALDYLGQLGLDVDQYRPHPAMARVAAQASVSALDRISMAKTEQDMMLALNEFEHTVTDSNRRYALDAQKTNATVQQANAKSNPYAEREQAAKQYGLTPDNPAYEGFILTGKMPREDAQPLSATDKKAILEADEAVQSNQNTIDMLRSVIDAPKDGGKPLNERAGSGVFAGTQAFLARNDPLGILDDNKGEATTELDNVVLGQALSSLKATFGGAPTEGERKILLDLQASINKTPRERKIIIDRAIELAEKRQKFSQDRAGELRGGDFYKAKIGERAPAASQSGVNAGGRVEVRSAAEFEALPKGARYIFKGKPGVKR